MATYIKNYEGLQTYLTDNEISILENPTDEEKESNLYFNFNYYDISKSNEDIQYYFRRY